MIKYFPLLLLAFLVSCQGNSQEKKSTQKDYAVVKTEAEWKASLSTLAYRVLRQAATERPFTGPLNNNKKEGTYVCSGCKTPLYESQHKFDSGTGVQQHVVHAHDLAWLDGIRDCWNPEPGGML